MKNMIIRTILLFSLMFFSFFAAASEEAEDYTLNTLQEYCAKEQDPLKRLNYCNALEQYSQSPASSEKGYIHTVIV